MVERGLQDQRLPARTAVAMAAMQRTCRELRARRHVGVVAAEGAAMRAGERSAAPRRRALRPNRGGARDISAGANKRAAAARKNPPVIAAHRFVGDGCSVTSIERASKRGAPLRRRERSGLGLARPQHVGERTRRAEALLDRFAAAGTHQIVGVLAVRQRGELEALARLDQRQRDVERAIGRAAAGVVAVEAQDRLVGHPPHQRKLIGGERGAERRDGRLEARRRHGDHIDIALDRDHAPAVMRGLARRGDVVERRALVEERRLRRIEIFRLQRPFRARGRRTR